MSNHHPKRRRSRSPAPKREGYKPRHDHRHHHHSSQSNRQYDRAVSINDIISHSEEYSPIVQSLVRELLLEQGKHKITEERLNRVEHENANLRIQYEQTMNSLALLKRDFDQYRSNFKSNSFEFNELRHSNNQYRSHMDEPFYSKRQRRH